MNACSVANIPELSRTARFLLSCALAALSLAAPPGVRAAAEEWGTNLQTHDVIANDFNANGINVGTVRVGVRWTTIQPHGTGAYQWGSTDPRVQAAANAVGGQNVLCCVANPPAEALSGGDGILPTAAWRQAYANYFLAVVQRYAASPYGIKNFEICNEPDLGVTAGDAATRAAAYREILTKVWDTTASFRSANPTVKFVGMVMAKPPVSVSGPSNTFFDTIWNDNANYGTTAPSMPRNKFHILSFHTYTGFYAPEPGNSGGIGQLWGQALQPTITRINGAKPLWISEGGYSTGNDGKGLGYNNGVNLSYQDPEGYQAKFLVRMAAIIRGAGDIDRFIQFNLYAGTGTDGESQWGLVRADDTHKFAFSAFKRLTTVLDNSVTAVEQMTYSTNGVCKYRYTKPGVVYGWVAWTSKEGATTSTTMSGTGSTAWKQPMTPTGGNWTQITPFNGTSVTVDVTNSPIYVEIRP